MEGKVSGNSIEGKLEERNWREKLDINELEAKEKELVDSVEWTFNVVSVFGGTSRRTKGTTTYDICWQKKRNEIHSPFRLSRARISSG